MGFPLARQYFLYETDRPDEQINLAKAALYIAQEEYLSLDLEAYLNALDTMADEVQQQLPSERYPLRIIQTVNRYLYDDLGFTGNTTNYYDPCNSFLNDVIERRTGIPITLSLVYLEVTKRLDFPMLGVGMPGHFLIRPQVQHMEIFVDPFNRGEILFAEDCQEKFTQIYGQTAKLQSSFLHSVSNRQFLSRMLINLKFAYLQMKQLTKALAAVERILLLYPALPVELRDRGLLCYQLGDWSAAIDNLQAYLEKSPNALDASAVRRLLDQLERISP